MSYEIQLSKALKVHTRIKISRRSKYKKTDVTLSPSLSFRSVIYMHLAFHQYIPFHPPLPSVKDYFTIISNISHGQQKPLQYLLSSLTQILVPIYINVTFKGPFLHI